MLNVQSDSLNSPHQYSDFVYKFEENVQNTYIKQQVTLDVVFFVHLYISFLNQLMMLLVLLMVMLINPVQIALSVQLPLKKIIAITYKKHIYNITSYSM